MDPEIEDMKAEARSLNQKARWLSVEIPDEWYVTDDDDFEVFIGGLYHDRVRAKIQTAYWRLFTSSIGLVGGVLGIAAFVRSC
jgi:hypothetical protein